MVPFHWCHQSSMGCKITSNWCITKPILLLHSPTFIVSESIKIISLMANTGSSIAPPKMSKIISNYLGKKLADLKNNAIFEINERKALRLTSLTEFTSRLKEPVLRAVSPLKPSKGFTRQMFLCLTPVPSCNFREINTES